MLRAARRKSTPLDGWLHCICHTKSMRRRDAIPAISSGRRIHLLANAGDSVGLVNIDGPDLKRALGTVWATQEVDLEDTRFAAGQTAHIYENETTLVLALTECCFLPTKDTRELTSGDLPGRIRNRGSRSRLSVDHWSVS